MKREQINQKVKEILVKQLTHGISFVKESYFTDDAKIIEDLGADSLDVLETTIALEDEFDMVISDEEMYAMSTIADACELVAKKIEG